LGWNYIPDARQLTVFQGISMGDCGTDPEQFPNWRGMAGCLFRAGSVLAARVPRAAIAALLCPHFRFPDLRGGQDGKA
jgi:hypothetical protein